MNQVLSRHTLAFTRLPGHTSTVLAHGLTMDLPRKICISQVWMVMMHISWAPTIATNKLACSSSHKGHMRACHTGVEKMSWLLEMEGYSPKNSPPFAVTKQSINVLQSHYPERLGHAVIAKPPCIFNLAWNAFYPFPDRDTRDKNIFVKGNAYVVKALKGILDLSSIDRSMGGSRPGEFDLAQYRERMNELQSKQKHRSQT